MQRGLRRLAADFAGERDHLPFNRTTFGLLRKLKVALSAGNVEVRRFEKAFLHAKAYIVTSADGSANEGIIAGSSNLTGAGLNHNLELNLGRDDEAVVRRSRQWFDDLWEEAEPYDLASVSRTTLESTRTFRLPASRNTE